MSCKNPRRNRRLIIIYFRKYEMNNATLKIIYAWHIQKKQVLSNESKKKTNKYPNWKKKDLNY